MIDLFLSSNKIVVFIEQNQLLETVISSESDQIAKLWLKDFVNTNLKIIFEDNF